VAAAIFIAAFGTGVQSVRVSEIVLLMVLAVACLVVDAFLRRWFVVAVVVATLLFSAVACMIVGLRGWAREETALRDTWMAERIVERFVEENGRWPSSWGDLEWFSPEDGANVSLPSGGWAEIREYTDIEFDVSLSDVARQRVEEFDAIRPRERAWGGDLYRDCFASLIETARRLTNPQNRGVFWETGAGNKRGK
jgi:hypothetical protein